MSLAGRSILNTQSLSTDEVISLFQLAQRNRFPNASKKKIALLLFFEASTRTRLSFEIALHQLGFDFAELGNSSSTLKGESQLDTLETVLAMKPDLVITRFGENSSLSQYLERQLEIPLISGGTGTSAHPTQALTDALTILQHRGKIEGEKVLIVGDIKHSRVATSNVELLTRLGARLCYFGPREWLPETGSTVSSLKEGIAWATVIMALRIQRERHNQIPGNEEHFLGDLEYFKLYGVKCEDLNQFNGLLLHPGPVLWGVEVSKEVKSLPQCKILDQVRNGVSIRKALLASVTGLEHG